MGISRSSNLQLRVWGVQRHAVHACTLCNLLFPLLFMCVRTRTYVCMCVFVCVCVCLCVCVSIPINVKIHMYVRTYIHTYIHAYLAGMRV